MSTQENKAIVLRHLKDVLDQRHVELIESCFAPEGNASHWGTPEQWKALVQLLENGVIPLEKIEHNRSAVLKFVDALNRQDAALLAEVCTPEVAKSWTELLPRAYARYKDHHIELVDMVADGELVAVKMATFGYYTGEAFGIPATGKWWTNHGNGIFYFSDGKIAKVDLVFDVENHIRQLGGTIQPAAAGSRKKKIT